MSDGPQTKPREFIPVDSIEALSLLKEATRFLCSTLLWVKDQEFSLHTHLGFLSEVDRRLFVWPPPDFNFDAFRDALARARTNDCYFSVSLQRANVFFRTRFDGMETNGIRFYLPESMYKVQRRADVRFVIPDSFTIKLEFDDPTPSPEPKRLIKPLWDVSAGGLSFVVTPEESRAYKAGLPLQGLRFSIRSGPQSKPIDTDAIVRHVARLPENARKKGCKIGCQFRNLSPSDSQALAAYVFEESRKYYLKYL